MDISETSPAEDGRFTFPLCPFLLLIYENPLYIKYISPFYSKRYHLPFILLIMHFNKQYHEYIYGGPIFQPFVSCGLSRPRVFLVPLSQVSVLLCTLRKCFET